MAGEAQNRDYVKWAKENSVANEIRSKAEPEAKRLGKVYDPNEFDGAEPDTKVGLTERWLDRVKKQHGIDKNKVYGSLGLRGNEPHADKVARIKEFQAGRGLKADGIIGPKTLEKLDEVSGNEGNFDKPVKVFIGGEEMMETYSVEPENKPIEKEKPNDKTQAQEKKPENTSSGRTNLDIPSLETPVQKQIKEANAMLKVNQEKLDNEKGKEKTILATLNTKEADLKNKMTAQENAQKAFDSIDIPKAQEAVEIADQKYEDAVLQESKAQEEFASSEDPDSKIAFEKVQADKASAKELAKKANKALLEMEQKKMEAKKLLDTAKKEVETANKSMQPLKEERDYIQDNIKVIEDMKKETEENIKNLESTQNHTEKSPKEISSFDVEDRKEDGQVENDAQAAEDAKKALETNKTEAGKSSTGEIEDRKEDGQAENDAQAAEDAKNKI